MGRMISVDRKEIKKFIRKVAGRNVPVKYFFLRDSYIFMEVLFEKSIITINKYWFNNKSRITKEFDYQSKEEAIKTLLFHEIGHIKIGWKKNRSIGEYLAQKWAIEKAQSLKENWIKKKLENNIFDWSNFRWNKDKQFRRYILASKIYKKEIKNG